MTWPIDLDDVRAAQRSIAPYLTPTPLRRYVPLDEAVGRGVRVWVKHENHQPTNAFKVRNGLSVVARLTDDEKRRGVVSATRGNHGQGLAWAGSRLGVPVTLCVPHGNNPEKNEAMRGFGGVLVEEGSDYDDALEVAFRLVERDGLRMVHPTNDRFVIAGAATITAEVVEQMGDNPPEAMVVSVGGGSQAVGAMTVMRALLPGVPVFGVQAAAAPTIHDSWHAGESRPGAVAQTLADGLATRNTYEMTFDALREGLAGFVTVDEDEIAGAIRLLLSATHNLAEGAGAAGLAGLIKLRDELAGKRVAVVLSGGNIDRAALRRVLAAGD